MTLGSSGCMLDSRPLQTSAQHTPATSTTSTNTNADTGDVHDLPDAQVDGGGAIVTGQVCVGDAASCGTRCRRDSECPMPSACGHRAVCVEGLCQDEALPDSSRCDDDSGSVLETCQAGASECVQQKLRSCGADGRWSQALTCEHGCSAIACNECAPGATQCSGTNAAQSCNASGHWDAGVACESGCVNGHCKLCTQGAKRCSSDMQETCSADGAWQSSPCSLGCAGDHCASCKVGTRECTGSSANDVRVCGDNGEWGPTTTCASSCSDGQCSDCSPGAQRCAGPGMQLCGLDRRWQTLESCPNGCDGMACASCREGAFECPSRTTIRMCSNHMWTDTNSCRPNAHCDSSAPAGNTCPCDSGYIDPHPSPGLCMQRP